MKSIHLIEPSRLAKIPEEHWAAHEFCFHLHDLMLQLLRQMDIQKAGHIKFEIESEEDRNLLLSGMHVLDFLAKSGRRDLERRAVVNHLSNALYADMLNFIYEGLRALEKRKFSVAFNLLRKPFKEGMLIAAQLCADETAFFERMKSDAQNLLNKRELNEDGTKALLKTAIKACRGADLIDAESVYSVVFDRGNDLGFAGLFDKATHLVTEYSKIRTENYNINFIFKDPRDNDIYEGSTYADLATLLLFLNLMQLELYGRMREPSKKYRDWMLFTSIGAFEALFTNDRSGMTALVNRHFKDYLKCPICEKPTKVKKADAPRFFVGEVLHCPSCRSDQHFPLGWLLSQLDLDLFDPSPAGPTNQL